MQGSKLDGLIKDFTDFKKEIGGKIEVLTLMVHKDKNMEGQLNQTLGLLLEELQKRHERAS